MEFFWSKAKENERNKKYEQKFMVAEEIVGGWVKYFLLRRGVAE